MNKHKIILSLFDYSGNWSRPYHEAGYTVIQQDIKHGADIFADTMNEANNCRVEGIKAHGILAAVPCTDFAASGARWWKMKEGQPIEYDGPIQFDDRLEFFTAMVLAVLVIVEWLEPAWWAIENPVGRIEKLVPEIGPCRLWFQPWWYGDPYTKKTGLWGRFNANLPRRPVLPIYGSKMHNMSSEWKEQRSETPPGFARAFFESNP